MNSAQVSLLLRKNQTGFWDLVAGPFVGVSGLTQGCLAADQLGARQNQRLPAGHYIVMRCSNLFSPLVRKCKYCG